MIGFRNMEFVDISANMTNENLKYLRKNPFSHLHIYDQNGMYGISQNTPHDLRKNIHKLHARFPRKEYANKHLLEFGDLSANLYGRER